jgi:hypothetical protein
MKPATVGAIDDGGMMLPRAYDLGDHTFNVPDPLREAPFAHVFGVLENEGAVVLLFAKDEPPSTAAAIPVGHRSDVTTVATVTVTPQRFQEFAAYIQHVADVLRDGE